MPSGTRWARACSVAQVYIGIVHPGEGLTSRLAIQSYCILRKSKRAPCSRPLLLVRRAPTPRTLVCSSVGYCPIHDVKD